MEQWLIDLALKGGPGALFLSLALLWLGPKINRIQNDVSELKKSVTSKDTCDALHKEVDRRFNRIERKEDK